MNYPIGHRTSNGLLPTRSRDAPAWPCVCRALIACGLLAVCGRVGAQEALRASLAGQQAAEAKKHELSGQKFNVKLGPVALRVTGSLGIEGNDNVRV